jgi:hypothetical protein
MAMTPFQKIAPMGTLTGKCYFCLASTPFLYRGVRVCYRHWNEDVKTVLDVQRAHIAVETKQLRKIINYYN